MSNEKESLTYEQRRCVGCKCVYTQVFVFDCPDAPRNKDVNFVLCPVCAVEVFKRMTSLKKNLEEK